MKAWYIECSETGERWSRNRWATTSTIPDLYVSERNAQAQINHGKAGQLIPIDRTPIVKQAELKLCT